MSRPTDIQAFLDHYQLKPGRRDDTATSKSENWEFYAQLPTDKPRTCAPYRLTINDLHEQWFGDYERLEREHSYIQWLFPIREHGLNHLAMPLQPHEVEKMKADTIVMDRIIKSYSLMLDFYGMQLVSIETGLIKRSDNYRSQYRNLCRHQHNNLRITRILKCLSELGLEHLNAGFLLHVLNEQSEFQQLNTWGGWGIMGSMDRYWAECLRNAEERTWIGALICQVREGKGEFTFTKDMYEAALERRNQSGFTVSRSATC